MTNRTYAHVKYALTIALTSFLGCGQQQSFQCPRPFDRVRGPERGTMFGNRALLNYAYLEEALFNGLRMGAVVFDYNTGQPLGLTLDTAFPYAQLSGGPQRLVDIYTSLPPNGDLIGHYLRGEQGLLPPRPSVSIDYALFSLTSTKYLYDTRVLDVNGNPTTIKGVGDRVANQYLEATAGKNWLYGQRGTGMALDFITPLREINNEPLSRYPGVLTFASSAEGNDVPVGLMRLSDADQSLKFVIDRSVNPFALNVRMYDMHTNPVAFFRYRDRQDGAHLYTTDWSHFTTGATIENTTRNYVFEGRREGAMFRTMLTYQGNDTIPVYWVYNSISNDSVYTTSLAEKTALEAANWCPMNEVGFVLPRDTEVPGTIPLYRWYNSQTNKHFYSTNLSDIGDPTHWTLEDYIRVFAHDGEPDPSTYADPPRATYHINEACSSAELKINGQTGRANLRGAVGLTIDPACTGPVCGLTIANMDLTADDFSIGGNTVQNIRIYNTRLLVGSWENVGMYSLPPSSAMMTSSFLLNGQPANITVSNTNNVISGDLDNSYTRFTMNGTFTSGDAVLTLGLCGGPSGRPPVAAFSPLGPFECTSPAGATVDFSSAASFDPDSDIQTRYWRVDGTTASVDALNLHTTVPLGQHPVSLTVTDSRGVSDTFTRYVTVVDTVPPMISLRATPNCVFPPNHKFVVYTLGENLIADVTDACAASTKVQIVKVTSNQSATGGGSGSAAPDYVYDATSLCLRSERAGTSMTPREYTITVEANDGNGGKTQQQVVVTVPHDEGMATKCPVPPQMLVNEDDPRCAVSNP